MKGNLLMTRRISMTWATACVLAALTSVCSIAGEAPQQILDAPPPMAYTVPAKGIRDYVKKAVESPARAPFHTVHDYYRKPAEILQFANIKPGQRVVELSSYGNYWSPMLSEIVGAKGELHMYDAPFAAPAIDAGKAFASAHPNTTFTNVDFNDIEFPRRIDLVWCFTCFHEVLGTNTNMDPFLAKMYKAMKPGGTIMVVFFTARDGMENRDMALHRIDQATIRGTFQAAGFQLQEENRLLQNPQDDRKSLVETEAQGDLADRMIFRFIKP